jgi:hypothetical protein
MVVLARHPLAVLPDGTMHHHDFAPAAAPVSTHRALFAIDFGDVARALTLIE